LSSSVTLTFPFHIHPDPYPYQARSLLSAVTSHFGGDIDESCIWKSIYDGFSAYMKYLAGVTPQQRVDV
jgi:hypothetical protein